MRRQYWPRAVHDDESSYSDDDDDPTPFSVSDSQGGSVLDDDEAAIDDEVKRLKALQQQQQQRMVQPPSQPAHGLRSSGSASADMIARMRDSEGGGSGIGGGGSAVPREVIGGALPTLRADREKVGSGPVHVPHGWGARGGGSGGFGEGNSAHRPPGSPMSPELSSPQGLGITDLDTGRTVPFEHADMLWQPLLVRDLDANILLPFAPEEGRSAVAEEMLNPPPEQMRFMSCALERTTLPPPLSLPEYRLYKIGRKRKVEMFAACRRTDVQSGTHFDVRWQDGVLSFTGKLELLPQTASNPHMQELAMYDDYINYYGFPRELGFIRTKQLTDIGEAGALLELIIPRVSPDGSAAQFRVGAVPGQTMLSMYKSRRAREHMFVLRGRLTVLDNRAVVELRHRDEKGRLNVVLQARRQRTGRGDAQPWRVGFAHPLSAFQTFCVLLALHTA